MAMDPNEVAAGLAAAVDAAEIPELTALSYVPDALPEPVFCVAELDIEYDKTMGDDDDFVFTCRLFVSRGDDKSGQERLREFMASGGDASIKRAIEADRTLGGVCHDLRVRRARGNRLFVVGEKRYYGVEYEVFVMGDGA